MRANILGLKELRENMQKYASLVERGRSFMVVRKSKPVFKMVPPETEEEWETVVDFTKINKNGLDNFLNHIRIRQKKFNRPNKKWGYGRR